MLCHAAFRMCRRPGNRRKQSFRDYRRVNTLSLGLRHFLRYQLTEEARPRPSCCGGTLRQPERQNVSMCPALEFPDLIGFALCPFLFNKTLLFLALLASNALSNKSPDPSNLSSSFYPNNLPRSPPQTTRSQHLPKTNPFATTLLFHRPPLPPSLRLFPPSSLSISYPKPSPLTSPSISLSKPT